MVPPIFGAQVLLDSGFDLAPLAVPVPIRRDLIKQLHLRSCRHRLSNQDDLSGSMTFGELIAIDQKVSSCCHSTMFSYVFSAMILVEAETALDELPQAGTLQPLGAALCDFRYLYSAEAKLANVQQRTVGVAGCEAAVERVTAKLTAAYAQLRAKHRAIRPALYRGWAARWTVPADLPADLSQWLVEHDLNPEVGARMYSSLRYSLISLGDVAQVAEHLPETYREFGRLVASRISDVPSGPLRIVAFETAWPSHEVVTEELALAAELADLTARCGNRWMAVLPADFVASVNLRVLDVAPGDAVTYEFLDAACQFWALSEGFDDAPEKAIQAALLLAA